MFHVTVNPLYSVNLPPTLLAPGKGAEGVYLHMSTIAVMPTESGEFYYPLTRSKLEEICKLKPAELKIYLYLKTLDPFGDQVLEVDIADLQQCTGIKSLGTIYPALGLLHQEGYIQLRSRKLYVHVPFQKTEKAIGELKNFSVLRKTDQKNEKAIGKLKKSSLEPAPSGTSSLSQTIKTIQTKKIERAEDVDESDPEYLRYVRDRVSRFKEQPAFPEEVVERQARKISTKRAYLKTLEKLQRDQSSAAPLQQNFTDERSQRIETLRAMWAKGEWQRVESILSDHTEWDISLSDVSGATS